MCRPCQWFRIDIYFRTYIYVLLSMQICPEPRKGKIRIHCMYVLTYTTKNLVYCIKLAK